MPTFACGLDGEARQIGPAVVQATGGFHEVLRHGPLRLQRIEVDGRTGFDRLRNRLVADPRAREARQLPAIQAELQHVGDVRRIHHRHMPGHHCEVALMRHRRRHATVIVTGHHQHTAMLGRTVGVAVLERVACAIHARALAVPHRKHTFDGAFRVRLDPLRAEHGRAAEFLVDRRQEANVARFEQFLRLPQLLVDHAERRAAIAADEAGGVHAASLVQCALHQHETHQRLRTGQENAAAGGGEVIGQLVIGEGGRAVNGQASGHGKSPFLCVRAKRMGTTMASRRKRLYFLTPIREYFCWFPGLFAQRSEVLREFAGF
jgi:hypothetical protein